MKQDIVKRVIVTADDFGLSPEINNGIVQAYKEGIVRSTALLMNAPATDHAIALAKMHPGLEVGIHLGIVEGICLSAEKKNEQTVLSSILDDYSYFEGRPCLLRSWKKFATRYLRGAISLEAIRIELDAQLSSFSQQFEKIPFANSTQHLHLLPGLSEIVVSLACEYGISAFRSHASLPDMPEVGHQRWLSARVLRMLGVRFKEIAHKHKIRLPDGMFGFPYSGHMEITEIISSLEVIQFGTYELMTHPGYDCLQLKRDLPWAFEGFNWQGELSALTDMRAKDTLRKSNLILSNFSKL